MTAGRLRLTPFGDRRRRQRAVDALPDLVELLVIAIRAGATPIAAFDVVAPLAPPVLDALLSEISHRLHRGQRLGDALGVVTEAMGPIAAGLFDALVTADRYGLAIAPVLDRLADDIRAERRRRSEREARTLPVKLAFPLVTCTLPSFVLLAIVPAVLGAVSTLRGANP